MDKAKAEGCCASEKKFHRSENRKTNFFYEVNTQVTVKNIQTHHFLFKKKRKEEKKYKYNA